MSLLSRLVVAKTPQRFSKVGLVGWGITLGSVVSYDVWASRTGHPTMSRTLGHFLAHPVWGPVLAGSWCGLTYHLLIEELIPEIVAERLARGTGLDV
jgi:hypothetical protein